MNDARALLEFILSNIPGVAGQFTISELEDEVGVTYKIKVESDVMALLIGRKGRHIKAIRDVVSIVSRASGRKVFIKLLD